MGLAGKARERWEWDGCRGKGGKLTTKPEDVKIHCLDLHHETHKVLCFCQGGWEMIS